MHLRYLRRDVHKGFDFFDLKKSNVEEGSGRIRGWVCSRRDSGIIGRCFHGRLASKESRLWSIVNDYWFGYRGSTNQSLCCHSFPLCDTNCDKLEELLSDIWTFHSHFMTVARRGRCHWRFPESASQPSWNHRSTQVSVASIAAGPNGNFVDVQPPAAISESITRTDPSGWLSSLMIPKTMAEKETDWSSRDWYSGGSMAWCQIFRHPPHPTAAILWGSRQQPRLPGISHAHQNKFTAQLGSTCEGPPRGRSSDLQVSSLYEYRFPPYSIVPMRAKGHDRED